MKDEFIMDRRLELLLLALAEQYAPQLAQSWDRKGDLATRLPIWARQLANYNILVIMGDFPSSLQTLGQDVNAHIQDWVNSYGQLYHLFLDDRVLLLDFLDLLLDLTQEVLAIAHRRWPFRRGGVLQRVLCGSRVRSMSCPSSGRRSAPSPR